MNQTPPDPIHQSSPSPSSTPPSGKIPLGFRDFFPYPQFRKNQENVIGQLTEAMALGKNSILIATNGTGKTIMALSAALPVALHDKKRKIIFCSRTFTQNARVIQETKTITQHFTKNNVNQMIGALSLRGRNEMCPHKTIQRLQLPPSESMSVCSTLRKNKRCSYFNHLIKKRKKTYFMDEMKSLSSFPLDAQDLLDFAEQDDVCPYFLSKFLMENEDIIVCNYMWVFDPIIRKNFLETIGCELSDCIIIMDECHNLPEMANNINSYRITPYSIRQALKDLEVARATFKLINFVKNCRDLLGGIKNRVEEEIKLDAPRFLQKILQKNKLSSMQELQDVLVDLREYGEAINQEKIDQGQTPRDFIAPLVIFFSKFIDTLDDPAYFPCVTAKNSRNGKTVALELKCLSPRFITDPIFTESFATLSLSGTLHPFTYTQLLGMNDTGKTLKIIKMDPPFPEKNAKVLITKHLSTRGESRTVSMYRDILVALKPVLQNTPKNVGVFCASYEVVEGLWNNGFEKLAKMCKKKAFREQKGNSASENDILVEQYKNCINHQKFEGGTLLGVCGGRNSEGEDFPGDYMNTVVIVGIPFQRPTPSGNAKIQYYDRLFPGKGRDFGYIVPALQRSNQACGRPIRKMDDKGLIILMDFRFKHYRTFLSEWVRKYMKLIPFNTQLIESEVRSFFEPK
ncbi:MAG: helicase C-terminal domain-containing protein [Promethearchaeota archaeon]